MSKFCITPFNLAILGAFVVFGWPGEFHSATNNSGLPYEFRAISTVTDQLSDPVFVEHLPVYGEFEIANVIRHRTFHLNQHLIGSSGHSRSKISDEVSSFGGQISNSWRIRLLIFGRDWEKAGWRLANFSFSIADYLCGGLTIVDDKDRESSHTPHFFAVKALLNFKEQLRSLGVHDGLSIEHSGFSRCSCLGGLPPNEDGGGSPDEYKPTRVTHEPPLLVPGFLALGFAILAVRCGQLIVDYDGYRRRVCWAVAILSFIGLTCDYSYMAFGSPWTFFSGSWLGL